MRSLILTALLCVLGASAVQAQTPTPCPVSPAPTGAVACLKVETFQVGQTAILTTGIFPITAATCNLAPTGQNPSTLVFNPQFVWFNDDKNPGRVCKLDAGAILSGVPPSSTAQYAAQSSYISDAGATGPKSGTSNPFKNSPLIAPTGLLVSP